MIKDWVCHKGHAVVDALHSSFVDGLRKFDGGIKVLGHKRQRVGLLRFRVMIKAICRSTKVLSRDTFTALTRQVRQAFNATKAKKGSKKTKQLKACPPGFKDTTPKHRLMFHRKSKCGNVAFHVRECTCRTCTPGFKGKPEDKCKPICVINGKAIYGLSSSFSAKTAGKACPDANKLIQNVYLNEYMKARAISALPFTNAKKMAKKAASRMMGAASRNHLGEGIASSSKWARKWKKDRAKRQRRMKKPQRTERKKLHHPKWDKKRAAGDIYKAPWHPLVRGAEL